MKQIHTERCLLRAWEERDLHDLQEIFCSSEIAKLAGFKVKDKGEVYQILQTFIEDSKDSLWCIAEKSSGKAIGWIEFHTYQQLGPRAYEIGYSLNKCSWGKGTMPEVLQAVIEKIREYREIEKIVCSHYDYNIQSKRVIEKCGFNYWKQENSKLYYVYTIK